MDGSAPLAKHIRRAMELADILVEIADAGETIAPDKRAVVFYWRLRDCGYRIRQHAVQERNERFPPTNAQERGVGEATP